MLIGLSDFYSPTDWECFNRITVAADGAKLLEVTDTKRPYLQGAIGVSVQKGSHDKYRKIVVKGL